MRYPGYHEYKCDYDTFYRDILSVKQSLEIELRAARHDIMYNHTGEQESWLCNFYYYLLNISKNEKMEIKVKERQKGAHNLIKAWTEEKGHYDKPKYPVFDDILYINKLQNL